MRGSYGGSQQVGEGISALQKRLMEHASATKAQKTKDVKADRRRLGAMMLQHIERDLSLGVHRDDLAVNERAGGRRSHAFAIAGELNGESLPSARP